MRCEQAAELLDVSTPTLTRWRQQGTGPTYVKLGEGPKAPVRYRPEDIEAYLEERSRGVW